MVRAVLHNGSNQRKDNSRIGDRICAIIQTPYVVMTRAEEQVCFHARAVGWAKQTSRLGVDLQTLGTARVESVESLEGDAIKVRMEVVKEQLGRFGGMKRRRLRASCSGFDRTIRRA